MRVLSPHENRDSSLGPGAVGVLYEKSAYATSAAIRIPTMRNSLIFLYMRYSVSYKPRRRLNISLVLEWHAEILRVPMGWTAHWQLSDTLIHASHCEYVVVEVLVTALHDEPVDCRLVVGDDHVRGHV